jgi:hypothetical protein
LVKINLKLLLCRIFGSLQRKAPRKGVYAGGRKVHDSSLAERKPCILGVPIVSGRVSMRLNRLLSFACCVAFPSLLPSAMGQGRGVFVTPIPNVPFLAVVDVENNQFLPDGTTVSRKTISAIARDSQGRIYNEQRVLIPASSGATPGIVSIHASPAPRIRAARPQRYFFGDQLGG